MKVVVLRETQAGETRVALVPESVRKVVGLKAAVSVESGAGLEAGATDADYTNAGAEVSSDRAALLSSADVLVAVNRPSTEDLSRMKQNAVLIAFLRPLDDPTGLESLVTQHITGFAMELIPRTTRAQAMDVLSS